MSTVQARYRAPLIALHWLMLALLAAVYCAMEFRGLFPKGSDARAAMKALHYMLGMTVLVLVVLRIGLRAAGTTPPIAPAPPAWQQSLARLLHLAMYAFMIAMPLLGWLILSGNGKAVPFYGLELPPLPGPDHRLAERIEHWHHEIGEWGYWLLAAHAGAALYHHYIVGDNTLARMLPWIAVRGR